MRTAKFAQGPVIVADDLKHPEQWRGPRKVFGDLPMRALNQIDKASMIFGRANVLGLQGPSLDETDDQRVGIRIVRMAARLEQAVGPIDIVFGHNDMLADQFPGVATRGETPAACVARLAAASVERTILCAGMSPPTRTT
jgi:hypothetical protein